ncbi:MAG: hypothetical protein QW756_06015 [Nitrososphaerota archaeon]
MHEQSRNTVGHGRLSLPSISAEDFKILRWVEETCREGIPCQLFLFSRATGEVRPAPGSPEGLSLEELVKRLDSLVERGLLVSTFDRKLLKCGGCGGASLAPRTACPSCHSENIVKSAVYIHTCGASIPESALTALNSCPKCRDALDRSMVNVIGHRFLCDGCGNLFDEPEAMAECYSCGWVDGLKNTVQTILKRYAVTGDGRALLDSSDPSKQLVRKLIAGGFNVREKVKVMGLSGTTHVMDVVAIKKDNSETRLYTVFYRLTPNDLIASTVKRLDIEKTAIEGAAGRVRWVVAGLDVDDAALRVAQTFGVEVEKI